MSSSNREPSIDKSPPITRRQILQTTGLLVTGAGLAIADFTAAEAASKTTSRTTSKRKVAATKKKATPVTKALTPAANCSVIPEETGGPFPGDATNGANVLELKGVVRSDIRSSIVTSNTVAKGVPLKVLLRVNSADTCKPLAGAAVYIWQCDKDGGYSMYSPSVESENYLRGVQEVRSDGTLEFITVFPAAYPGRWPHIHFEIFPSLAKATTGDSAIATSQLAFPDAVCRAVYASRGYEASLKTMAGQRLESDVVFADGAGEQLAVMTGSVTSGLTASLTINVRTKGAA
jgi:protocatechuate 3,4-dioxygenase beta subunit